MSRLRVAFVSQWFPPEPASQPLWIAQGLERAGCRVNVLTGVPNYPTGKVVEGYRAGRPSREVVEGLPVTRAPLYPSHDGSSLRRILNYASWALSSALIGQRLLRRSDVALVYSSPATAVLPAMVARRIWGTPFVLQIQDLWPDSIFSSGFLAGRGMRLVRGMIDAFVRRSYTLAQHIVVTSPGMREVLIARGVPEAKISVVYNWLPDGETARESDHTSAGSGIREALGLGSDDFVVMYAGNHGKAQALDALVDAFTHELEKEHLVMVGDGVEKRRLKARAAGNPRVHFLDPIPRVQLARVMTDFDAQAVVLADRPLFAVTMPSKVQAVLASATPALVAARGDAAGAVVEAGAGVTADPEDARSIAAAVRLISASSEAERREMGERGRRYYEANMAEEMGRSALAEILCNATAIRRPTNANVRTGV